MYKTCSKQPCSWKETIVIITIEYTAKKITQVTICLTNITKRKNVS